MSVVPRHDKDSITLTHAEAERFFSQSRSGSGSGNEALPGVAGTARNNSAPHEGSGAGVTTQPITDRVVASPPQSMGQVPQVGSSGGVVPSGINPATRGRLAPPVGSYSSHSSADDLDRPIDTVKGNEGSVIPRNRRFGDDPVAVEVDEEYQDYAGPNYHYTNWWFSTRNRLKPYFAEFLGTLILVLWGEGTQAQVLAARNAPDDYLSIAFGWGIGFMLAVYVSSGISGGHVNPAVTISLAIFRKFPKRKIPGYILAQMLGAFCGAGILFGVYKGTLAGLPDYDISVGKVFTTGAAAKVPNLAETFFSVFIGAALLLLAIAAFTDTGNNTAAPGLTPLLLGFVMIGIATAFGYQTGFVLNPARDMGPRLLVFAVTGISGKTLWLAESAYGIWIPWVGTVTGGIAGMFFYDMLIYTGRDSPVNFNYSRRYRKAKRSYRKSQRGVAGAHHDEEAGLGHRRSGVSEANTLAATPPQGKANLVSEKRV